MISCSFVLRVCFLICCLRCGVIGCNKQPGVYILKSKIDVKFIETLKVVIKYVAHNEYLLRIIGCSLVLLVCVCLSEFYAAVL